MSPENHSPFTRSLNRSMAQASLALLLGMALQAPAQAQTQSAPEVAPALKRLLGRLPLAEHKAQLQTMVGALKGSPCGGGLSGCYSVLAGPLQLYFFTSKTAQQTLLLVVDKALPMPGLLHPKVQKFMGDTSLRTPIFSLSTADFDIDNARMPASLQKVVREHYFNVNTLSFSSGVQLAARATVGGSMKMAMQSLGVQASQLTMRGAVVLPIPTDLAGGAGVGIGMAAAMQEGSTADDASADAMKPETFIEFQFGPNTAIALNSPPVTLTDATFFINNSLTFGYKGNAQFHGVPGKKIITHFQSPGNPAGALDLLDFQFRMATPPTFTLADVAHVAVAMATPDPRLTQYGGGFIRQIEAYKTQLLVAAEPLSAFQLRNPKPANPYRFADSNQPFPSDGQFNIVLLGPLADGGPYLHTAGELYLLGQRLGWLDATVGLAGMHATAGESIQLKLGPLGRVSMRAEVQADIDTRGQQIGLDANYLGQVVRVRLNGKSMTVQVSASCVNPFQINTTVEVNASTQLAAVFEAQGGANVDPKSINGCSGSALEAAYRKITGEYRQLSGYSANAAQTELNKLSQAANAAAAALNQQEETARQTYEAAKNAARDTADKANNGANKAFKSAGNAFKRLGKKKKHNKQEPNPLFAASVFGWDYYYDQATPSMRSDLDLATHWEGSGFAAGRQGSPEFNARFYRARYLDVQALCGAQDLLCALRHWLQLGLEQGRQASANFSSESYLKRSPDLQTALGRENYEDAMLHWLNEGEAQGRDGRPEATTTAPLAGHLRVGGNGGSAATAAAPGAMAQPAPTNMSPDGVCLPVAAWTGSSFATAASTR